ncbi:hypothetical protein HHL21_02185 [Massilia sp. RP-1-19]|uniref:Uncharacterized protein n=1 Tax=Massilia polaris TaxID=2728846 RepID=A0A848HI91_9BURK|nr:hypothetical protein [Massilia polaris]NML59910.1 hypothetical protein [Massilia polaris]
MSERSFALGCVGLALAVGLVVPDPGGRQPAVSPARPDFVVVRPAQQEALKTIDRMDDGPFAVHHAGPVKADATPALLSAVRSAP